MSKCSLQAQPTSLSLRAPAKINLSLIVFDRRPDNFHEIHTVMATVDFCDNISVSRSNKLGISLTCSGLETPSGPENLVYKAAQIISDATKTPLAVDIHLEKIIPSGAGLGGGSSDAAACLYGLNYLYNLDLSIEQLSELAAQLGSDVPFFLQGPVALCTGRGEKVMNIPHTCNRFLLLILPEIHCSTVEVYRRYQHQENITADLFRRVQYHLQYGDLNGLVIQKINSLTEPCLQHNPQLDKLWKDIENTGIGPLNLSGSGSCLYCTTDSQEQAQEWANLLNDNNLARSQVVRFLDLAQPILEVHHADI